MLKIVKASGIVAALGFCDEVSARLGSAGAPKTSVVTSIDVPVAAAPGTSFRRGPVKRRARPSPADELSRQGSADSALSRNSSCGSDAPCDLSDAARLSDIQPTVEASADEVDPQDDFSDITPWLKKSDAQDIVAAYMPFLVSINLGLKQLNSSGVDKRYFCSNTRSMIHKATKKILPAVDALKSVLKDLKSGAISKEAAFERVRAHQASLGMVMHDCAVSATDPDVAAVCAKKWRVEKAFGPLGQGLMRLAMVYSASPEGFRTVARGLANKPVEAFGGERFGHNLAEQTRKNLIEAGSSASSSAASVVLAASLVDKVVSPYFANGEHFDISMHTYMWAEVMKMFVQFFRMGLSMWDSDRTQASAIMGLAATGFGVSGYQAYSTPAEGHHSFDETFPIALLMILPMILSTVFLEPLTTRAMEHLVDFSIGEPTASAQVTVLEEIPPVDAANNMTDRQKIE